MPALSKFKDIRETFPSEPFALYARASGALYRQFILQNAAITSDMLAMRYFRRTLL
jgi:hypothetical protein